MLIEPQPRSFSKMIRNRPGVTALNAAICCEPESVVQFTSVGASTRCAQLARFPLCRLPFSNAFSCAHSYCSGIVDYISKEHEQLFGDVLGLKDGVYPTVNVSCSSLTKHFALLGIREVDFMSVDVEGAELMLLRSVDFARVNVRVVMVEALETHADERAKIEAVRNLMEKKWKFKRFSNVVTNSDLFGKKKKKKKNK